MLMTRRFLVLGCLLAMLCSVAGAQPAIDTLGPAVGTRVADFSGVDQSGRTQTLQSVMGPNGVMLVFFRSADW